MFKTAALAAIAALMSAPAVARGHAWQVGNDSIHLYNADLDMNSAAGRAALLARVERAALKLCRDLVERRSCTAAAVKQASLGPQAAPLRVAMAEREAVRVAAR